MSRGLGLTATMHAALAIPSDFEPLRQIAATPWRRGAPPTFGTTPNPSRSLDHDRMDPYLRSPAACQ